MDGEINLLLLIENAKKNLALFRILNNILLFKYYLKIKCYLVYYDQFE